MPSFPPPLHAARIGRLAPTLPALHSAPWPSRPPSSCSIAELLLVHHPAEHGRHPGALVEAEGAGVARRVDAEPDAVLAALPEARERVAEERRAHALLAPRATRVERVDPAAAVRVARADRAGGDLVPGADDAPERRVEALAPEVHPRPRLEIARHVVPGMRERFLVRGVKFERVMLRVERDDV